MQHLTSDEDTESGVYHDRSVLGGSDAEGRFNKRKYWVSFGLIAMAGLFSFCVWNRHVSLHVSSLADDVVNLDYKDPDPVLYRNKCKDNPFNITFRLWEHGVAMDCTGMTKTYTLCGDIYDEKGRWGLRVPGVEGGDEGFELIGDENYQGRNFQKFEDWLTHKLAEMPVELAGSESKKYWLMLWGGSNGCPRWTKLLGVSITADLERITSLDKPVRMSIINDDIPKHQKFPEEWKNLWFVEDRDEDEDNKYQRPFVGAPKYDDEGTCDEQDKVQGTDVVMETYSSWGGCEE